MQDAAIIILVCSLSTWRFLKTRVGLWHTHLMLWFVIDYIQQSTGLLNIFYDSTRQSSWTEGHGQRKKADQKGESCSRGSVTLMEWVRWADLLWSFTKPRWQHIVHLLTFTTELLFEAPEVLNFLAFGPRVLPEVWAHTGHMWTYRDTRYRGSKAYSRRIC